jgi:hypothetical protein
MLDLVVLLDLVVRAEPRDEQLRELVGMDS